MVLQVLGIPPTKAPALIRVPAEANRPSLWLCNKGAMVPRERVGKGIDKLATGAG